MATIPSLDPPSYSLDSSTPSPSYAALPSSSEITVSGGAAQTGSSSSQRFIYKTEHMSIDLGSRIWGLPYPCYGLHGRVEGAVRFSGTPHDVKRVSVTLMTRLVTSAPQAGAKGRYVSTLMSRTMPVFVPFRWGPQAWTGDHHFSIPLPSEINMNGGVCELPPSFSSWDPGYIVGCDVTYFVKVCMVRKSRKLRRQVHESIMIPILYLPKSYRMSVGANDIPDYALSGEIKTNLALPTHLSNGSLPHTAASASTNIYLPETIFTSGDLIPFAVSISSLQPFVVHTLGQCARVKLIKRMAIFHAAGKPRQITEHIIATGTVTSQGLQDEAYLITGTIRAGKAGKEASWSIPRTVCVEYVFRVTFEIPKHLASRISSCGSQKIVYLTTDPCGTKERELNATGGILPPALGLHVVTPRDDSCYASFANAFIC